MTTAPARRRRPGLIDWAWPRPAPAEPRRQLPGLLDARDDGTWEWTCLLCASATGHALGLDGAARGLALSGHQLAAHGEVTA